MNATENHSTAEFHIQNENKFKPSISMEQNPRIDLLPVIGISGRFLKRNGWKTEKPAASWSSKNPMEINRVITLSHAIIFIL